MAMATIKVMSGGAPKEVFAQLTPRYEQQSGDRIEFAYAVMSALRERIAAGETADVLVMPVPLLDGYQKDGTLRRKGRVTFGTVVVSMAVQDGALRPDISTREKFRAALLAARAIVHPTPGATPTGTHMGKVIEQLGLGPDFARKVLHRPALEGGVDLVANGDADLGFYPTSEVVNIEGITVAAPLPPELQLTIVYGAGVRTTSAVADAATAFLKFLSDPAHSGVWQKAGFEPAN
jgi:molybdate transport system substrate-binding protein